MLLGEHAVLHGRRALVCAINRRISVSLSPLPQNVLRIHSAMGDYEAPLAALADHPGFQFVLDAVKQYSSDPSFAKGYGQGMALNIESEFSSDIGFGSSAAVTVATHAALMRWVGTPRRGVRGPLGERSLPLDELFNRSLATIRRVQGRGSGADAAASVFGGVVAYRAEPLEIRPFSVTFPLTAVYSGAKMKTADVIAWVEERRKADPETYERIFDAMDAAVGAAVPLFGGTAAPPSAGTGAGAPPFKVFGELLVRNQKLMEEMGLCNDALAEIIRLFGEEGVPAKISGSGLGDCAVGLGPFPQAGSFQTYALQVEPQGAAIEM